MIGKVKVDSEVGLTHRADLSSAEQEVVAAADELVVSLRTMTRLGGGIDKPVICSMMSMAGGVLSIFMAEDSS